MTALKNNVVIVPHEMATIKNGIHIPQSNPTHRTGTVKSVGPEVETAMQEGQTVIYISRNCVTQNGCHIVNEEMIEAIL